MGITNHLITKFDLDDRIANNMLSDEELALVHEARKPIIQSIKDIYAASETFDEYEEALKDLVLEYPY